MSDRFTEPHRIVELPSASELEAALVVVRNHLAPTPLIRIGPTRWLKLESMQPTGSFKVRGAVAALSALPSGTRVVTASAGNHGLGTAWASRLLGVPATIVLAETASPRKIEVLRALGADLVLAGTSYDDAEAHALELAANGAHYLSPYNDTRVMAGQSTILTEIDDELPTDVEGPTLVVPVGGGGLLAGICLAQARGTGRRFELLGVEADASRAVSAAVAAERTVEVDVGETLADGLAGNLEPGSATVDAIRTAAVDLEAASEAEIGTAIRTLAFEHGVIAEGAAATSFAAMSRLDPDEPTIAIITGRNIAQGQLAGILAS